MKPKNIQKLIVKYITNSISVSELDELDKLLQDYINEKQFWDFVKINYFIDYNMKEYNTSESKILLLKKIKQDKKVIIGNRFKKVFKYAAILIFLLGFGYFIKQEGFNIEEQTLVPKTSFITLELENGNIKVISEDGSSIVKNSKGDIIGNQTGSLMVYGKNILSEKLVYNTLNVPYGKQFKLELSDSTIIYLNSGSSIKYPVKFLEGRKQREVFLTGEAFFEVAEDKQHPFIVNSDEMNIRVLGTKFNVSAYTEDKIKQVVLVEGSVELYEGSLKNDSIETTILKPGIKGSFDSEKGSITTEPVVTSIYTSWVDGELVFRNMIFTEILKKLERHYDVTIINKNVELANIEFNASFSNMPVGQIMEYFESVYGINFTVDHNKIIIK